jgi:DNA-binding HxlR family transcriptional regulator
MKAVEEGPAPVCPTVEGAFALLGRKWTGLILRSLMDGPRQFRQLERAVPALSARLLTERIRELAAEGIVSRTVDTGSPVRVLYALTEKGRALRPVLKGIEKWAREWADAPAVRGR